MAAGESRRWAGYLHKSKHLAPLNDAGQTIISRTIHMLKASGIANISVVARSDAIIDVVGEVRVIRPSRFRYLTDSILSSQEQWRQRTIILLGDVYFSAQCLDAILDCNDEIRFFGIAKGSRLIKTDNRRPELYAFTFSQRVSEHIRKVLEAGSTLARLRDEEDMRLACLGAAARGRRALLEYLFRYSYSPKPPKALQKAGFGRSNFWRVTRSLFSRPRKTWIYGKLWGAYILISGAGPFEGDDFGWPSSVGDYLLEINDITQDVDTAAHYESLLKALGSDSSPARQAGQMISSSE